MVTKKKLATLYFWLKQILNRFLKKISLNWFSLKKNENIILDLLIRKAYKQRQVNNNNGFCIPNLISLWPKPEICIGKNSVPDTSTVGHLYAYVYVHTDALATETQNAGKLYLKTTPSPTGPHFGGSCTFERKVKDPIC